MLLMVVGLWGFVSNYRIRGKQSVILFVGGDGCKAYVSGAAAVSFQRGDTLVIRQTSYGDLSLIIDSLAVEPLSRVLFLHPLKPHDFARQMAGNTYADGFLYSASETIGQLILRKLSLQ